MGKRFYCQLRKSHSTNCLPLSTRNLGPWRLNTIWPPTTADTDRWNRASHSAEHTDIPGITILVHTLRRESRLVDPVKDSQTHPISPLPPILATWIPRTGSSFQSQRQTKTPTILHLPKPPQRTIPSRSLACKPLPRVFKPMHPATPI